MKYEDVFDYSVVLNSSDHENSLASEDMGNYKKFDLINNPEDVCIEVIGSGMFFSYKSNRIVLTKELIDNLFKKSN